MQKKLGNWSKNNQDMNVFVQPERVSWKSNLGYIGQLVQIFKLGPQAQFLADQPNYFLFVDPIDTKFLRGIIIGPIGALQDKNWGGVGQNNLDQSPIWKGLRAPFYMIGPGFVRIQAVGL